MVRWYKELALFLHSWSERHWAIHGLRNEMVRKVIVIS